MKKGITISTLTITVIIMLILVSVSTVVGMNSIRTASYEEFFSKLTRVSNDVNYYVRKNNSLPSTNEVVAKEGLDVELRNLIINNGDEGNELFVIDMKKINTESVNIGYGTTEDMDVFLVAENTNNVYYLKGYSYKGNKTYGTATISTLGQLVSGYDDFGKTIDYVAYVNDVAIDKWRVFYKQKVDGQEYVYLISTQKLSFEQMPKAIEATGATIMETSNGYANVYWESGKLTQKAETINKTLWQANWGTYSTNINAYGASLFLDEQYWTSFKNIDDYGDYVVGAIGTPTAEMFIKSWNRKREEALKNNDTTTYNTQFGLVKNDNIGFYINTSTETETLEQTISTTDNLYIWSTDDATSIWLASPSAAGTSSIMVAGCTGELRKASYTQTSYGIRPVVCLKAEIYAKKGTTTDISLFTLEEMQ